MRDLSIYPEIPTYIGLTALNGWKPNAAYEEDYHLLGIESGGTMKVIGMDVSMNVGHLKLAEVCALSGAALAYRY
jgi:hypothetical protein